MYKLYCFFFMVFISFPVCTKGNELMCDSLPHDSIRNFYIHEIVKIAPRINKLQNPQMGMTVMDDNAIRSVPTLLGEPDVIKALQLQPGVSAGTEGFAGMFVRGDAHHDLTPLLKFIT